MTNNPAEALLAEIDLFLERTGTAPTAFGKAALSDPNFVWHLRAGREPRFNTAQRVRDFIASHQESAA
jgi:hypothetical protein